ncbi:hypothetical protein TSUD_08340 [Trifolium subterraneum]|nr:hypothetical protein TSUD_08340 [Trifolium subterraneum]
MDHQIFGVVALMKRIIVKLGRREIRQQWGGNKRSENQTVVREPRISSDATYEDLLGNTKPFHQPIPLREMVYFLVDIWEQEGLYD